MEKIKEKIEEILMKRYALEKVLDVKKIFSICGYAFVSFLVFLGFWYGYSLLVDDSQLFLRIAFVFVSILILSVLWWQTWKKVRNVIPKFVLVGMLGWLLITMDLTSDLIRGNGDTIQGMNFPAPLCRLVSLEPGAANNLPAKIELKNIVDIITAPGLIPHSHQQWNKIVYCDLHSGFYVCLRCVFILIISVLLTLLLLIVSKYRRSNSPDMFWLRGGDREDAVTVGLVLLVTSLLILGLISLNYFILFWVFSFLVSIILFRWEILERGQNHKPLCRALLFVILTQVYSSIWGEILLILFRPLYSIPAHQGFILLHTSIMGWTIILGSSVTVLIGIVTQVIWSGRRMTDRLRA